VQWGVPALFSPSMSDCNQMMIVNPEMTGLPAYSADPEIPLSNFKFDINNNTNFVNIGSINPTVNYNTTLNRFTFSELHTPVLLNSRDASESEGSIVMQFNNRPQGLRIPVGIRIPEMDEDLLFSRILATNLIVGEYYKIIDVGQNTNWLDIGATFAVENNFFQYNGVAVPPNATGIAGQGLNSYNDSQSGIYLDDVFFQVESGNRDISNSNSDGSVLMTRDTFYNSLPFKMGFDYYTLKPIRFSINPFNNRYNPYYQNRYNEPSGRIYTLSPITTNSDFDIANAISLNIFPQYRKQKGQPKFKLGYNNNESVNVIVNSYSITADDLPAQLNHGFYRLYVDFPMASMDYIGSSMKLPVMAYLLRNYQTGSYFYMYSSSYQIPITRDMPLNAIRVSIRNSDGRVAQNLNPKCVCFFKIEREVPLLPTLEEQEEEINNLQKTNPEAFKEIMKQFDKQETEKNKAFQEAQVQALAEGEQLVQIPVGTGYLNQQNTITIPEPQPYNLLGIPNMIEPAEIITLQQHAPQGVIESIGNQPPPDNQFDFDPPLLQPEPIQQILQPAVDMEVQGLIPTEEENLPIKETQYDFIELGTQAVPMINLRPEPEPVNFGNVEITPEQPDLFTRTARYTQQVESLLTDEKNKLKLDLTKQVVQNILNNYLADNPTIEGLTQTLINSSKEIANRLELIYDEIDKARTQSQYKQLANEVKKLTKDFGYTAMGDQLSLITRTRKGTSNASRIAGLVKDLGYLFYEQGGGFGEELAEGLSNKFTVEKIKNIILAYSPKIRFNEKIMKRRLTEGSSLRERTGEMNPEQRKEFIDEERFFRRMDKRYERELRQRRIEEGNRRYTLDTNVSDPEVRERLQRVDEKTPKPNVTMSERVETEREQRGDK